MSLLLLSSNMILFLPVITSPRSGLLLWISKIQAVSRSELAGGKRSKVIAGRHGCSEESLRGNSGCHGNSSERSQLCLCSVFPSLGWLIRWRR